MMKQIVISVFILLLTEVSNAQIAITRKKLRSVLKETLSKARNPVPTALNTWRYNNTGGDYFDKDTIILNTARTYKLGYCMGINWSFYNTRNFTIDNVRYCNEPPTKLISKKEDYIKLKIKGSKNNIYLELHNLNGVFDIFEVLELKSNEPLGEGESQFDYTIRLLRLKS